MSSSCGTDMIGDIMIVMMAMLVGSMIEVTNPSPFGVEKGIGAAAQAQVVRWLGVGRKSRIRAGTVGRAEAAAAALKG